MYATIHNLMITQSSYTSYTVYTGVVQINFTTKRKAKNKVQRSHITTNKCAHLIVHAQQNPSLIKPKSHEDRFEQWIENQSSVSSC